MGLLALGCVLALLGCLWTRGAAAPTTVLPPSPSLGPGASRPLSHQRKHYELPRRVLDQWFKEAAVEHPLYRKDARPYDPWSDSVVAARLFYGYGDDYY